MTLNSIQSGTVESLGKNIQQNVGNLPKIVRILVNDALEEDDYTRHASDRVADADEHEIFDIWTPKIQVCRHTVDDADNLSVWIDATYEDHYDKEKSWYPAGVRCTVDIYLDYEDGELVSRDVEFGFTESLRDREDGGGFDK